MFFVGGAASLVLTLFLFTIFPVGELDYIGAFIVGVVEETGKLLAIILFVKALKPKYILNGMLIGASVGAGFAVFETAGYAFRQFEAGVAWGFDKGIDRMAEVLFLRGWSSLGGHVAWAGTCQRRRFPDEKQSDKPAVPEVFPDSCYPSRDMGLSVYGRKYGICVYKNGGLDRDYLDCHPGAAPCRTETDRTDLCGRGTNG